MFARAAGGSGLERPFARLLGVSAAHRAIEEEIAHAARSEAKVLITGESGVGKELVAGAIHRQSRRVRAPFVPINCAGLPDSLLESELFGHVRGSFTGAYRDRPGLLEAANHGVIFMDEIGEMSLRMQALLLRFLEGGEIQRVGGGSTPRLDVRVIAATNRNLVERIASKEFREDLYYRLNVIHIAIPPLRERREDIPVLLQHSLKVYSERHRVDLPEVAPTAMARLVAYDWPGNVRELRNVVERLVVRLRSSAISIADLPAEIGSRSQSLPGDKPPAQPQADLVDGLLTRMLRGGESFWSAVYVPFMARDLTRETLRLVVEKGLEETRGSYRLLVELFNMAPGDYKKFLNFLRKYECHMPFQPFRMRKAPFEAVREPVDQSVPVRAVSDR